MQYLTWNIKEDYLKTIKIYILVSWTISVIFETQTLRHIKNNDIRIFELAKANTVERIYKSKSCKLKCDNWNLPKHHFHITEHWLACFNSVA